MYFFFFFFQAEDGIRDADVTGVQTCALPIFGFEIDLYSKMLTARLAGHRGYRAVQAVDGVGPTFAAVFVAEIGDVHRFARAEQLCSWAGVTPLHRESDTKVHRGRITKQGSTLVRWAAVEAVQRVRGGPIGSARARKLLTLVYYGLRDGHIRCLARPA